MNNIPSILLIEDDIDDQKFFLNIFNRIENAPSINVVHNGQEALDRLYRSLILPTVIFMDIHMPLMNGLECLKYIKEDPLINHIHVIMLTTSTMDVDQALQLGAKGFIQKTNNEERLRNALENVIQNYFPLKQG